jgi:hypothetical protein
MSWKLIVDSVTVKVKLKFPLQLGGKAPDILYLGAQIRLQGQAGCGGGAERVLGHFLI